MFVLFITAFEPFFDHVNRDWFDGLPYAEHLEFNKEDRENNWKGLLQGKIRDIIFIANEAEIDPQEDLIFYDEDGRISDNLVGNYYLECSLNIEPNKKIAIVGRSGNGKSTIFNLLLRYFDNNIGTIKLIIEVKYSSGSGIIGNK